MRRLAAVFPLLLCLGCATASPRPSVPDWSCSYVAIEMARCARDLEPRSDYCEAAVLLSTTLCAAVPNRSLLAEPMATTGSPGTGYRPGSTRVCHRGYPGGPEVTSTASWSAADPWELSCAGSPDALRCLRSDGFLDFVRPGVADAYRQRYGFAWTDNLGGWCGRSSEAASRVGEALTYLCLTAPGRINSGGEAAGWDCIATGREVTDSLSNGEANRLAAEFCVASEGTPDCSPKPPIDPPKPVNRCDPPKVCIEEPAPCRTCPTLPTIPAATWSTLESACKWTPGIRPHWKVQAACRNAVNDLKSKLGGVQ